MESSIIFNDRLIGRLNEKDGDAFYQIYNKCYGGLWYYANKIIRNKETAEDIVADTFVKLWNYKKTFESLETVQALNCWKSEEQ
jgi:DNA-directed RNA polymerase specialized sigma24 family protein